MTAWTLDRICSLTNNPQMLNALHACRPNHPLNNRYQWRDAWFLACQRPSYEISNDATGWLAKQAAKEEMSA
jgi:hypothetical protein